MVVKSRLRGLTAASLLCLAPAAGAQSTGGAPITPGAAEDFFREPPRIKPETVPTPSLPARPSNGPRTRASVQVKGFAFAPNSLYTEAQLQAIAAPYLKPEMSLAELIDVADHITEKMRADGYLVASAAVPAQKVQDGVIRFEIIEGKLDSLRVSGNQRYSDEHILNYVKPLKGEQALSSSEMERSLMLLNELPGVTARGNLSPGSQPGTTDLQIDVSEKRFRGAVGVNNYGSPELGRARADVSLDFYNPLRMSDHLNIRVIESQGSQLGLGRLGYDVGLAPGWRAAVSIARVDYRAAGAFSALGLKGNSLTRDASIGYAWIRTRMTNLTVNLGVRDTRTDQEALGQSMGSLHVRTGYINLTGYTLVGGGLTSGLVAVTSNGRREAGPGMGGDGVLFKTDFDLTHTRPVPGDFEFSQRIAGTYSADALPDTEKFGIGGPDSVRAYPIAQLRGDEGVLSVTEFRRRMRIAGTQAYIGVFYDYGWMRLRQQMLPAYADSLSGAGLTMAVTDDRFRLKLDIARALSNNAAADNHRTRFWITGTWFF